MRIIMTSVALATASLAASLTAGPAFGDEYTCEDEGPCIVEAEEVGNYRVRLRWSGQGTSYDFYNILVGLHGGGPSMEVAVTGRHGGQRRFDLHEAGDYEITVAGCYGSRRRVEEANCLPSSEKVRMNLR